MQPEYHCKQRKLRLFFVTIFASCVGCTESAVDQLTVGLEPPSVDMLTEKKFRLEESGPPVSHDDISAYERELGGKLPEDYKQFLMTHNGGSSKLMLSLNCAGRMETFTYFDPLLNASDRGLRSKLRSLTEISPAKVAGYMPIIYTLDGRYICLAYRGPEAGAVFYTEFEYKVVYIRDLVPVDVTMIRIADSFTDLLAQIVEIPEPYCPIVELGEHGTAGDLDAYLAEGNSINAKSKHGFSLLCEAIKFDNTPLIDACLEQKADLSQSVFFAVQTRRVELIPRLVAAGADVNERDEFGQTPFSYVGGTALPGSIGARNRELEKVMIGLGAGK